MAARPGGWIPSPRLCFAFVLRLPSFGDAGEGVFFWLVGPALTGCAVETRIFLTVRSCGTKACSDGLGHLRRPLSTAVADRSNSGGRKPGRWFFLSLSLDTASPPSGPPGLTGPDPPSGPLGALGCLGAMGKRRFRIEPLSPAPIPPTTRCALGVLGEARAVAPQVGSSVYSVSVVYPRCILI